VATTFADLKTYVQAIALSSDATSAGTFINDGYIDVCAQCSLGETNATKNLTSGQTKYSLTSDFSLTGVLRINELRYIQSGATANFSIVPAASMREVLDLNSAAVTGWTRAYAFEGADTLLLAPSPATGDTITIYYTPSPTALSGGTDVPSAIPSQYQERLLTSYGAWRLAEGENGDLAESYHQKYNAYLAEFKTWMVKRQANTARGMTVGYPSRPRQPFHDRSTYYSGSR